MRIARITRQPSVSSESPWNAALYDSAVGTDLDGYVESRGAASHAAAVAIADEWTGATAATGKLFLATCDTYRKVTALADSPREAKRLAAAKARDYLRSVDALRAGETDTIAGIIEYFGINAVEITVGAAIIEGEGEVW